jgi:hypothetical protein
VVAQHADVWNCPSRPDIDEYRRNSRILNEHCKAVGRDPLDIARQVQLLVSSDPAEPLQPGSNVTALIDAAATEIVLAPVPPWPQNVGSRLAENIIAPLN